MGICVRSLVVIVMLTASRAAVADEKPSALEQDPTGWTDLLAQAGSKLEGWTRGPLPPRGKLNSESQWSLDSSHRLPGLRG